MDIWTDYLNLYSSLPKHCERSWSFLSEPINTVSSIAFFISAYFAYNLLKNNKIKNSNLQKLPIFIVLIGIGSTLYHGFNSPYTLLADQIPIFIFVIYSIFILLGYLTKNILLRFGIPVLLIFLQFAFLANSPLFILGMPIRHIINILFVTIMSIRIYQKFGRIALEIIPALSVYSLGIFIRVFEEAICTINGFGIHSFWHICAAFVTYLIIRFLVNIQFSLQGPTLRT